MQISAFSQSKNTHVGFIACSHGNGWFILIAEWPLNGWTAMYLTFSLWVGTSVVLLWATVNGAAVKFLCPSVGKCISVGYVFVLGREVGS